MCPPDRPEKPVRRVAAVGAVVRDATGRLLVVRRKNPPSEGLWSIPGGHVEPGETPAEAVVREVREETGLIVEPGRTIGTVERDGPAGTTYEICDIECAVLGGSLEAASDATDARWVTPDELIGLPLTPLLAETLRAWHVL
jgi:ADP-ribose pyrophosphatase YjhB (NUDIX family)